MKEQSDINASIIAALSTMYSSLVLVDVDSQRYEFVESVPFLDLDSSGPYKDLVNTFVFPLKNNSDKEQLENNLLLENLCKTFNDSITKVHYEMETNLEESTFFEMDIICAEKKGNETKKILIATKDITAASQMQSHYNDYLKETIVAADKAVNAKNVFLSNLSHDIRTPLNAVAGMAHLAKMNIDNREELEKDLEKLNEASDQLVSIINQILNLTKIETGNFVVKYDIVELDSLINDLFNAFGDIIFAKHQRFTINTDNVTTHTFWTDKKYIFLILKNILENSIKYTQEGGSISLTVNEIQKAKDGITTLEFMISDTGTGMERDVSSHIFDPFYRSDSERTTKVAGAGLGLAISNQIVQMMNGTIMVESEKGKGTTMSIQLPVRIENTESEKLSKSLNTQSVYNAESIEQTKSEYKIAAPDYDFLESEAIEKSSHNKKKTDNPKFPGKRILIVEDNDLNAEIAKSILNLMEIETYTASDGLIAIQTINKTEAYFFDLILMDIKMPNMNGYETAKAIRSSQRNDLKKIPIVALTADTFPDDIQRAISCGMNAHLGKPLEINKLNEILETYL